MSYQLAGEDGVLASEFAKFMVEVKEMAILKTGRVPPTTKSGNLVDAYELAQRMIDAHDNNDDGAIDWAEFLDWVEGGLNMTKAEQKYYRSRGGHFTKSADLLENIAYAFHK